MKSIDVRLLSSEQVIALFDNAETLDRARVKATEFLVELLRGPQFQDRLKAHPDIAKPLGVKVLQFIALGNQITETADEEVARILCRPAEPDDSLN